MVSPFTQEGMVDIPAALRIVDHIVSHGASPFVLGTTGEAASISSEQKHVLVKAMVQANAKRSLTFAGISSNSFETSLNEAKRYFDEGVDYFVAHPPSYYPLFDHQIVVYFEKLADGIPAPLVLYNIPSVTHCSISINVIESLCQHPNIIGIKDSERDLERLKTILNNWGNQPEFAHLVGWGKQMTFGLLNGSSGIVPSSGNLVPHLYVELYQAAQNNEKSEAENLQHLLDRISRIYQEGRNLGQSLAALKVMLSKLKICEPYLLPPLNRLTAEEDHSIIQQMKDFDVLTN
jgi:4-hydroxy-tetrahydrodipicolinate synthase